MPFSVFGNTKVSDFSSSLLSCCHQHSPAQTFGCQLILVLVVCQTSWSGDTESLALPTSLTSAPACLAAAISMGLQTHHQTTAFCHAIRYVAKLLGVMQKGSLCVAAATSIALHTLTDVSCCKYCWYQQNCYHHPKSSNHKIHKGTAHVFPADAKIHLRTKPRGNPVLHQLSMSATW